MTSRRKSSRACRAKSFGVFAWAFALALVLTGGVVTPRALAQQSGPTATVSRLNKQALDAFDNLNFEQAKALLEQALAQSESTHLGDDPVTARTHLILGMLFIAGFQQREQGMEQFRAASRIQPGITAPAGLFNPEAQAAFDEVKAEVRPETAKTGPTGQTGLQPSAPPPRGTSGSGAENPSPAGHDAPPGTADGSAESSDDETEDENEGAEGETAKFTAGGILLSVGLGSGFGVARGTLDANRDLDSDGNGTADNKWSGGLAPSRLGHLSVAAGYFLSPRLMLSLEGRLQIITGTTIVKGNPQGSVCIPSCSSPSTALAVFAKGTWFTGTGPLRPFVTGGLGGGAIRQVVKLAISSSPPGASSPGASPAQTGCGDSGTTACVDTVTGGPFWLVAGGGVAYEIGALTLLGSLTANVGMPSFMFNVDALFGLGLRL